MGRWWQCPHCPSPQCPSPQCPSPQCPSPQCPSPQCPSPQCHSPWGISPLCKPGWLGTGELNQSLRCRRGDGCCVRARVRFFSRSVPLFAYIYLRHWLLHLQGGFLDRSGFISFLGFVLVLFYALYYGTSHMKCFCNSWRVKNLLGMALRFNKPLKLAESIVSLHTWLLRPSTNFRPCLQCILCSSRVINNTREDSFPLPWIFLLKKFTSGSWGLEHIKLQHPEYHQVARQKNRTICSMPRRVEPAKHCEFNANEDSVNALDGVPYLEHFENVIHSES